MNNRVQYDDRKSFHRISGKPQAPFQCTEVSGAEGTEGSTEYIVTYNPSYRTSIDKKNPERLKINHPDVYDD